MALSVGSYSTRFYESTVNASYAANAINVGAGSIVLLLFAGYKSVAGTLPQVSTISNSMGLTFTRKSGYTFGSSNTQIRCEIWTAYCPTALTGLVATAFMNTGGHNASNVFVAAIEIKGVQDKNNIFDPSHSNSSYIIPGLINPGTLRVAAPSTTKSLTMPFDFLFLVNPVTAGTLDSGSQIFNLQSSAGIMRAALYVEPRAAPAATKTATWSVSPVTTGSIVTDTFNGEAPLVIQSRPVVIITQ